MEKLKKKFEEWCREFGQARVEPMSKELSKVFISLTWIEMENAKAPPLLNEEFSYKLIDKRAEYIKLDMSECAKCLLACVVNTPGDAVMFLYYLKSKNIRITIAEMANIFPMGFPTEAERMRLWDLQKYNGVNMLDMIAG